MPYRRPNFGSTKEVAPTTGAGVVQQQNQVLVEDVLVEEWPDGQRQRQYTHQDNRRMVLTVKPAKLNISEFEGVDPESRIQNLEQYFAAARTPIEHRTELAVSYLKGPAVQWWRGTGYAPNNVPWHRFCSYLTERFATESVCDVVSSFHAAHQTSTVAAYVEQFEQLMNIMRRENPGIPNDYYVTSFVSGLTPYIKSHVECFKPKDLQTIVWYARRMEKATAPALSKPYFLSPKDK